MDQDSRTILHHCKALNVIFVLCETTHSVVFDTNCKQFYANSYSAQLCTLPYSKMICKLTLSKTVQGKRQVSKSRQSLHSYCECIDPLLQ